MCLVFARAVVNALIAVNDSTEFATALNNLWNEGISTGDLKKQSTVTLINVPLLGLPLLIQALTPLTTVPANVTLAGHRLRHSAGLVVVPTFANFYYYLIGADDTGREDTFTFTGPQGILGNATYDLYTALRSVFVLDT